MSEVSLSHTIDVVSPSPSHRTRNASIRSIRPDRLSEAYEVAEAYVGSIAHEQVHMVRQDCPLEYVDSSSLARVGDGELDLPRRGLIHASHAEPRVPSDMSE